MRKFMNRTLLSQCVLMALTSFGTQAAMTTATPCEDGVTMQTCGLTKYTDDSFYQNPGVTNAVMADATANNIFMDGHRGDGDTQSLTGIRNGYVRPLYPGKQRRYREYHPE